LKATGIVRRIEKHDIIITRGLKALKTLGFCRFCPNEKSQKRAVLESRFLKFSRRGKEVNILSMALT
jgi:hypothetical protein